MSIEFIHDVKKIRMQYNCDSPEEVFEKGFLKANFEITQKELEDDEARVADITFEMLIDSTPIDQDTNLEEVVGKISITFRMIYETENNVKKIENKVLLREIEPFIRKELIEFYNSVGLPNLAIPYGFWKNAEED